ncbi:hypothetical protein ACLOJK_012276 [Asimina triloba]
MWLDLAGSGWIWVDVAGSGWIWLDLAGSGWIWLDLAGSGHWLDLGRSTTARERKAWLEGAGRPDEKTKWWWLAGCAASLAAAGREESIWGHSMWG